MSSALTRQGIPSSSAECVTAAIRLAVVLDAAGFAWETTGAIATAGLTSPSRIPRMTSALIRAVSDSALNWVMNPGRSAMAQSKSALHLASSSFC